MPCTTQNHPGTIADEADVIVVGAGPGGSAAAYHMARHGLRVLLLEKTEFPREKVCGDGLTPRAVRQLVRMGVDTSEKAGWLQNKGLRVIGGGVRLELDWPDLASFPNYGLVRTRMDFDDMLAQRAVEAGALLRTGVTVTGPVLDEDGRAIGVTAKTGPGKEPVEFRAPLVVAADGVSGKLPIAMGLTKRDDRPIGVAVRRYYHSPVRADDDYLESWLELRSSQDRDRLLPGYGWIFGLGDGRVNVGLGILNSSSAFGTHQLPRHAHRLAGRHARRLGPARRGQRGRPDPGRRAPDGLQPGAALHPGAHAGRRLRRHGQPDERRGHRVRDGVRRARRRGRGAGAGPPRRRRPGAGPARLPDRAEACVSAATTASAGYS